MDALLWHPCPSVTQHPKHTTLNQTTQVKSKGLRRISFEQFLTALSALADKKGVSFEDMVRQMLAAGGPVAHATKADAVRLHDDR